MQLFYEASYVIIHILHNKISVTNVNYLWRLIMTTEQNPFWAFFVSIRVGTAALIRPRLCFWECFTERQCSWVLPWVKKHWGSGFFGWWTDCVLFWLHQNQAGKRPLLRHKWVCPVLSEFTEENIMIQYSYNVVCSCRLHRGHSRSAAWWWWRFF